MVVEDLRRLLDSHGLQHWYRLLEHPEEDTYCLILETTVWKSFYFERGKRWDEEVFATEAEACEAFAHRVLKDAGRI